MKKTTALMGVLACCSCMATVNAQPLPVTRICQETASASLARRRRATTARLRPALQRGAPISKRSSRIWR
jgi:hypothetical protein